MASILGSPGKSKDDPRPHSRHHVLELDPTAGELGRAGIFCRRFVLSQSSIRNLSRRWHLSIWWRRRWEFCYECHIDHHIGGWFFGKFRGRGWLNGRGRCTCMNMLKLRKFRGADERWAMNYYFFSSFKYCVRCAVFIYAYIYRTISLWKGVYFIWWNSCNLVGT